MFIDELPFNAKEDTKLLRNICRAVHIPTILSGTNAAVNNLLGRSHISTSRNDGTSRLWVKVISRLPKATISTISHAIKFRDFRNPDSLISLDDCMKDEKLFLSSLLDASSLETIDLSFLEKLIHFIFEQVKTNLPGLAVLSLNAFINVIEAIRISNSNDCTFSMHENIWKMFANRIITSVTARKSQIMSNIGQLAGAHVLTFTSNDEGNDLLRIEHESDVLASSKIDNNLFYYGTRGTSSIIELSAGRKINAPLKDVELKELHSEITWIDHCFFPSLSEDFFSHLVIWNSWWDSNGEPLYSLSGIYLKYLTDKITFPVDSKAKVVDSFTLELLSNWAIAYASHCNISGQATGVEVTRNFVRNLQSVSGVSAFKCMFDSSFTEPNSLNAFLERIKLPYLVNHGSFGSDLKSQVSPFIRLGEVLRPENCVGCDILFDLYLDGGIQSYGLIECKLWSINTDCATIFTYYKRACAGNCPLFFMVGPKFASELLGDFCRSYEKEDVVADTKEEEEEEDEDDNDDDDDDEEEEEEEEGDDVVKGNDKSNKSKKVKLNHRYTLEEARAFLSNELKKKSDTKCTESQKATKTKSLESSTIVAKSKSSVASSANDPGTIDQEAVLWKREFRQLWAKGPQNHINIYSLRSIVDKKFNMITVKQDTLKEFENPTGVFIIVESNFVPHLRSHRL